MKLFTMQCSALPLALTLFFLTLASCKSQESSPKKASDTRQKVSGKKVSAITKESDSIMAVEPPAAGGFHANIVAVPTMPVKPPEAIKLSTPIIAEHKFSSAYTVSGLSFNIRLNGMPIGGSAKLSSPSGGSRLSQYLMPGENTIELRVFRAEENGHGEFTFSRQLKNEKETILTIKYDAKEGPIRKIYSFQAKSPLKLWQEGEIINLTPVSGEELIRAAKEIHEALTRRDARKITEFVSYRTKERGLAYGKSEEESLKSQREFIETYIAVDDFKMDAFDEKSLQLELAFGGRVVRITRPDEMRLLASGKGGNGFDANFGRIKGKYILVR